jgi:hypothetical protein
MHLARSSRQGRSLHTSNTRKTCPACRPQQRATPQQGVVWDYYRTLSAAGWRLDASGYSTAFRLLPTPGRGREETAAAIAARPAGLAASFNLGAADFYPAASGKEGAAAHLLAQWGGSAADAAHLCDDDNDLPLAALVGRAFIPGITEVGGALGWGAPLVGGGGLGGGFTARRGGALAGLGGPSWNACAIRWPERALSKPGAAAVGLTAGLGSRAEPPPRQNRRTLCRMLLRPTPPTLRSPRKSGPVQQRKCWTQRQTTSRGWQGARGAAAAAGARRTVGRAGGRGGSRGRRLWRGEGSRG